MRARCYVRIAGEPLAVLKLREGTGGAKSTAKQLTLAWGLAV